MVNLRIWSAALSKVGLVDVRPFTGTKAAGFYVGKYRWRIDGIPNDADKAFLTETAKIANDQYSKRSEL